MKRMLICLLACLLLTGCSVSANTVQNDLDVTISENLDDQAVSPNNRKSLFAYYIEPSVGRLQTNQTSSLLTYNDIKFVMNLNIAKIVNNKYYQDANGQSSIDLSESLRVANNTGTFTDYKGNEHNYDCRVYLVDSGYFLTYDTDYVSFYVSGNQTEIFMILPQMIKIAKTISINDERIVATYSSKETIEYTKQALELFQAVIPENGRVDEMIDTVNGNATINNNVDGDISIGDNEPGTDVNNDNYQTDNYQAGGSDSNSVQVTQEENAEYSEEPTEQPLEEPVE